MYTHKENAFIANDFIYVSVFFFFYLLFIYFLYSRPPASIRTFASTLVRTNREINAGDLMFAIFFCFLLRPGSLFSGMAVVYFFMAASSRVILIWISRRLSHGPFSESTTASSLFKCCRIMNSRRVPAAESIMNFKKCHKNKHLYIFIFASARNDTELNEPPRGYLLSAGLFNPILLSK